MMKRSITELKQLIDQLEKEQILAKDELIALIESRTQELSEYLFEKARRIRRENYGHDVYLRGLIEFTNYCKNDCYYCGIRRSNRNASRYRLTKEQNMASCKREPSWFFAPCAPGGEDGHYCDELLTEIIRLHKHYPYCSPDPFCVKRFFRKLPCLL